MRHVAKPVAALASAGFVLSAEHWLAEAEAEARGRAAPGRPLRSLVAVAGRQQIPEDGGRDALILDTSAARRGLLDVPVGPGEPVLRTSARKCARPGDVLVSRLRPYLMQIALVPRGIEALVGDGPIYVSPEFYVLRPAASGEGGEAEPIAYLVPWLLGPPVQAVLQGAATGGHHPRVPRDLLLGLRVPETLYERRAVLSAEVNEACLAYIAAQRRWGGLLDAVSGDGIRFSADPGLPRGCR
jgi:hypothetical protein